MQKSRSEHYAQMYNERGAIAERYAHLQALHILEQAKVVSPLPKASAESVTRAIFQAAEVVLLNMVDLLERATNDIQQRHLGAAQVKLSWLRGFHQVMVRLSTMPEQLGIVPGQEQIGTLSIMSSPTYSKYLGQLQQFDTTMIECFAAEDLSIETLIATQSLDNTPLNLIHLARLSNHETTIWEYNLRAVAVPVEVSSYEAFVVTDYIEQAVYDTALEGDTYYTQFRGLHQVPELLCAEINDHIEAAILDIRAQSLQDAYAHLRYSNILFEGITTSLQPIMNSLTTSDYHIFRENLGFTSGSHSVNFHYHLFRDLYSQLWQAFAQCILLNADTIPPENDIATLIRHFDKSRFDGMSAFLIHLLANEFLRLRAFTHEWRNEHLHLPRNDVGGSFTKSLTGSSDAIQVVKRMRDAARMKDPMLPLVKAREISPPSVNDQRLLLTAYIDSPQSLDNLIMESTGRITKERCEQIQKRLGVFAQKCPFSPPPKRMV